MVAYRKQFVQTLESLWPFVVEFEDDGTIKEKEYPPGCEVGGLTRPIILITHDESTFSSNNSRRQAWVKQGTQIIRPKGRGQGIMVSVTESTIIATIRCFDVGYCLFRNPLVMHISYHIPSLLLYFSIGCYFPWFAY